jgi:hypothetical protein
MKVTLTFKTPDAVDVAAKEFVNHMDDAERAEAEKIIKTAATEYVQFGELVRIELDTETVTAKVLKVWR